MRPSGLIGAALSSLSVCGFLLVGFGCSHGPAEPTVDAGQVTYTITADGASTSQQWNGSALLRSTEQQFWVEFNTTSSSAAGSALWYFANGSVPPATLIGTHPIRARGVGTADTVWVWWGHIVTDDPRTTGTLHLTRIDSVQVDGTFTYHAPAGTGAAQHFITIEGQFSAARCGVIKGGPCSN
jgi:hypothetical protein